MFVTPDTPGKSSMDYVKNGVHIVYEYGPKVTDTGLGFLRAIAKIAIEVIKSLAPIAKALEHTKAPIVVAGGIAVYNLGDHGCGLGKAIIRHKVGKVVDNVLNIGCDTSNILISTGTFAEFLNGIGAVTLEAIAFVPALYGIGGGLILCAIGATAKGIHNERMYLKKFEDALKNNDVVNFLTKTRDGDKKTIDKKFERVKSKIEKLKNDPKFVNVTFEINEEKQQKTIKDKIVTKRLSRHFGIDGEKLKSVIENVHPEAKDSLMKSLKGRIKKKIGTKAAAIVACVAYMIGIAILIFGGIATAGFVFLAVGGALMIGKFIYDKFQDHRFKKAIEKLADYPEPAKT